MADEEASHEEKRNFCQTFYIMAENVGSRLEKVEERNLEEQGSVQGNGGEEPPPSPSTSESSSSSHHHHHRN